MKILLLFFFSFALCTLQKAFNEYSQLQSISEEEFAGIQEFISRVEAAKSEELVTEEDSRMLFQLGFEPLFYLSSPSQWDKSTQKKDSKVTWGKIDDFCTLPATEYDDVERTTKIDPHKMPFVNVLKLFYCFESVDSLSRDEFFDFYRLLDFIQGGRQYSLISKMESLNETIGATFANSDLQFFAQSDESLKVLLAIWSPGTLLVDSHRLTLRYGSRINVVLEKVLEHFARKSESTSIFTLRKLKIKDIENRQMQTSLFEILEKNADTLTSLSISNFDLVCPRAILLPNLTELSIMLIDVDNFKLHFLLHSNYTVLEIDEEISISEFSGKKYFHMCAPCYNIDLLLLLIEENKNLAIFNLAFIDPWKQTLFTPSELEKLKLAVSSLKYLKSHKLYGDSSDLDHMFHPENTIHSLSIDVDERLNWESLLEKLPHLKNLSITMRSLEMLEGLLRFIPASKLESISLIFNTLFNNPEKGIELISALNQSPTLIKIDANFMDSFEIGSLRLNERFVAFSYSRVEFRASDSRPTNLPSGLGIKYVKFPYVGNLERPLTLQDLQAVKERFPNLQLLILSPCYDIEVSLDEVDFEVRTEGNESDDELFESVPSLTLN